MNLSEARTNIRSETDHDSDTQVTDDQLDEQINQDYFKLRRRISQLVPSLYTETDEEQTLSGTDDTLDMPADFERLVRLERQYGSDWYPVEISDELTPHLGILNAREEADGIKLAPVSLAPGTYRLIYVMEPQGLDGDTDDIDVPGGCEDIIVQWGAAFVRRRHDEDPSAHMTMADQIWREQKKALLRRYGKHAAPGLRQVRRW